MPTIVEVAERAGVAVSTVSYALSGKRPVSDATRQRIQAAIDELGYHPNVLARGLATKRSQAISLFYPMAMQSRNLSTMQFEFFAGVTNVASQNGYGLLLWTTPQDEFQIKRLVQEGMSGGLILMEVKTQDPRVDLLRELGFPFALIGHTDDSADLHYVDVDFAEGIRLALRHLAELGHRHVAFINFEPILLDAGFGPAVRLLEGFETGLAETGICGYVSPGTGTADEAAATFQSLRSQHPDISAVIVANEIMAMGVSRLVYQIGLRIPDDLSVIVVASDTTAERLTPPLTNIVLPAETMGRIGAEMLIDQLEGREVRKKNVLLAAELTDHGSTRRVEHG
jgi:DNA-binding LacI/PurR family transcriptional regulator